LNSDSTVVANSYLAECHGKGYDSQAIASWDGAGPFKIVNNTLIGAGENVFFGGADPSVQGRIPSDIELRRNYIYKPTTWRGVWTVKNLMETKNAQRVLIEGNVFDGSWGDAQTGWAVIFKSENQGGTAPWSKTADVTMRYNVFRNVGAGINIAGAEGGATDAPARILIEHNLMQYMDGGAYNGDGRLLQILTGPRDLTITRNTLLGTGYQNAAITTMVTAATNISLTYNVFTKGTYGFFRDTGLPFAGAFSGVVVLAPNVIIPGPGEQSWPGGTLFAPSLDAVPAGYGADGAQLAILTSGVVVP
jgi:hypothetical protein